MISEKLQSLKSLTAKHGITTAGCVLTAASLFECTQGINSARATLDCKSEMLKSSVFYNSKPGAQEKAQRGIAQVELESIHQQEYKEFGLSFLFGASAVACFSQAYFPKRK